MKKDYYELADIEIKELGKKAKSKFFTEHYCIEDWVDSCCLKASQTENDAEWEIITAADLTNEEKTKRFLKIAGIDSIRPSVFMDLYEDIQEGRLKADLAEIDETIWNVQYLKEHRDWNGEIDTWDL